MKKNIVTMGGGTGTFVVLSSLKGYQDLALSAIVNVTDNGGSTGRLRDEYGTLPVGDFRQALVALADEDPNSTNHLLRKLFLYRFGKGDCKGHNFGNIFLTAMTDILGSEERAIRYASEVLNISGTVIPITTKDIDLVAKYSNGSVLVGEKFIDEPPRKHDGTQRITELSIQPSVEINPRAEQAIREADYIILGPGDLYSSTLSNIVVDGTSQVIQQSNAKLIYIVNFVTKRGQTHKYTAQDHVNEIARYTDKYPDYILYNNTDIPPNVIERYKKYENAQLVVDDLVEKSGITILREDLLSSNIVKQKSSDKVKRALIRHDSKKLSQILYKIINS